MGFARKSSLAVGDRRGGKEFVDGEAGCAIMTEVRTVRRGIDAESRARSAVCRRCGRRVSEVLTPAVLSSSGKLLTCSVTCTSVRGINLVKMMLRSVL